MSEAIANRPNDLPAPPKMGWIARRLAGWSRVALCRRLDTLKRGRLILVDGEERRSFGPAGGVPEAEIVVRDPRFYTSVALGGSIGSAESYALGDWESDDLTSIIRIFALNPHLSDGVDEGWARLRAPLQRLSHWWRRNSQRGSRRNIAAHYDLGNDFFELFLDPSLMYSCAVYPEAESSLEEASWHKLELICRKLELVPEDEVLEIGTGWGGFAIHAASRFGCRVVTTTISRRQFEEAQRRVEAAGLADRITIIQVDYRDLPATLGRQFDKLVSIEMIEAVGHAYLDRYFGVASEMLKPEGMMLLQAITIADQQYESYRRSVDFIQRYIFPGAMLPSMAAMTASLARATDFRLFDVHDITPHYARTLADWRRNFSAEIEQIRALGYEESFLRIWKFYFCYCEGGFSERVIGDVQMLLTKPLNRREPIDYGALMA